LLKRNIRQLITRLLVVALVFRALIPAGFMPASDRSFTLEICPEGLPAHLFSHAGHSDHSGKHWHIEHCVFGSACVSGPLSHHPGTAPIHLLLDLPARQPSSAAIVVRLVHLPPTRGPPVAT
jgi:hypothetical protein